MTDLIVVRDRTALTTTLAIAEGTGHQHVTIMKLVRKYQDDLTEFGPLGFEIHVAKRPQGGCAPTEYALLNEHQATLLMTYMRNSDVVGQFKKRLVKAFYAMGEQISHKREAEAQKLEARLLRAVRREIAADIPAQLEHYAKAAAQEEQRQGRVKEKIRRLLAEATPRHQPCPIDQRLAVIEAKLDLIVGLLQGQGEGVLDLILWNKKWNNLLTKYKIGRNLPK